MKKIILFLLVLVSINGLAQFPATQSQGTINTKVVSNGGFQAMKGLINGVYADTSAANAGYIDFYTGAQIYCTSDQYFYLRDTLPMRWTKMAKFSDLISGTDKDTVYRITTEGQSNNLGTGDVGDLPTSDNYSFTAAQSRVYIFNPETGIYEKLYVPNNNQSANNDYYTAGVGTIGFPAFGPELGISQRWMQETSPSDTLFIDKNTVDGGVISAFQSGTDYYDTILARRAAANAWLAARGKHVLDIGYHWVQGEGNSATSQATYEAALETLIDDRVADNLIDTIYGIVVLAQISTSSASYGAGPAAAKVSYVAAHSFARLTTYTDNFNVDNVHLNATGQLQLAYDAYQQILQTGKRNVGLFSLTNYGRTGAASLSGNILNIPDYYNIIPIDTIVPVSANLKGYWAMEETSGDVLDVSGNGFDLTRINSTASVTGKVGLGSGFTAASSQALRGSASNSLSAGVGLTIACWWKPTAATSAQFVMSKWSTSGNFEYVIYWNSLVSELRFAMSSDGTYQAGHDIVSNTSGAIVAGSWYYVVGVWDGVDMTLYINNTLAATTSLSSAFNTGTANFTIGDGTPSANPSSAIIDEAMVWNVALTPTELTYWYNSGAGRTMSLTATNTYGIIDTASTTIIQVPNLEVLGGSVFEDSVYFENVPYNSGAGIVHLGIDTVAASPTFGKLVRKTAGGSIDTLTIATRAWRQKGLDSLAALRRTISKGFFLETPGSAEAVDMWQTPVAITVSSLKAILRGSTPSVTYNIKFGTDITSATSVFTSDITCTSVTTGCSNSSGFNDATIPAGSFIWIVTTAASGTITSIGFTLNYTED